MLKAVLFDLDHTLYDRDATLTRLAPAFLAHFRDCFPPGFAGAAEVADRLIRADKLNYSGWPAVYDALSEDLGWTPPGYERFRDFFQNNLGRCAAPYPETHEVLQWCAGRGLDVGLVTNGGGPMQNEKIDALGIRKYMKCILISGEAGVQKPDPAIFALAVERMGQAPRDIAFVGDNPVNDILASEAAGMTAIWLDHFSDWPEDRPRPKFIAHRLKEAVGILADLV